MTCHRSSIAPEGAELITVKQADHLWPDGSLRVRDINARIPRAGRGSLESIMACSDVLKAQCEGVLDLVVVKLDVYVLEDGQRVFSARGLGAAFHLRSSSGVARDHVRQLPGFLASDAVFPCVSGRLTMFANSPVPFTSRDGRAHLGYRVEILPEACRAISQARRDGRLRASQLPMAEAAEQLRDALAGVGLIAAVDEVTGYQRERPADALSSTLKGYLADKPARWERRFPPEFHAQMARIANLERNASGNWPGRMGQLTNEFVYDYLPTGLRDELNRRNPPDATGQRKYRFHQMLTPELGIPHLQFQLGAVTVAATVSTTMPEFKRTLGRVLPVAGLPLFDLMAEKSDEN